MLNALTLPLVGLLISLPGLPGLPSWSSIKKLREKPAAPLDTLPPAWKSASRLALENQFVLAALPPLSPDPVGLRLTSDPRKLRMMLDPDSGTVRAITELGSVAVGETPRVPLAQYTRQLTHSNFERLWRERARSNINTVSDQAAPVQNSGGLAIRSPVPLPLPTIARDFLGPGNPALTVSGSENIQLSGTSEWTNQQVGLLGQKRSLFPALDMQQDLDIRLEGQLSDRVKVNLLQNSAAQIPLANRIAINYKGDEDDLVQALDLGNTNLSLPGTQYVSYSGKNEGLFGMKATTRLGPLDFTVLASKQEGRSERASYSGGASKATPTIGDKDYARGQYFFFYDPNRDSTTLELRLIDEGSIQVFLDEGTYGNQINLVRGRAFVDPLNACPDTVACGTATTPSVRGNFKLLSQGSDKDYEILDLYGPIWRVLRLRTPVSGVQRLAVIYRFRAVDANGNAVGDSLRVGSGTFEPDGDGVFALTMQLLRPPSNQLPDLDHDLFFDEDSPFARSRELELKNFYNLGWQGIDPKTFELAVHKGDQQPPKVNFNAPGSQAIPYLELVGLDNLDESNGLNDRGHDGRIDLGLANQNFHAFVDFSNGVLFFYEPRPFAPRIQGPGSKPFDRFISDQVLFRRARLDGPTGSENEPNRAIYDKIAVESTDRSYSIDLSLNATRNNSNEITLGRTNIIEGSVVVTFNGQPLVPDKDFRVDYDLGRVTLIKQPGPSDQVNVDYSYAPLFAQAGKTLLGSAFRYEGRDRSIAGAFLYESKGASDLRPRLGEEPSRTLIGDVNTDWRFRPDWLTHAVDLLPGIRTTTPSELNISAEMGGSMPNPNTRNEVFIDDMEGVRDAVVLSMGPERWKWSSVPLREGSRNIMDPALPGFQKYAETHWFTPLNAIKERELKPSLTNAQGAQNSRQVLAISLPRRPTGEAPDQPLWTGLTYPLDRNGVDLRRAQFIDLWVNDFRDFFQQPGAPVGPVRGRRVKLHVDLGVVPEDEIRVPNIPPNGRLDTEDTNEDDQLSVTDNKDEDTGFDKLKSPNRGLPGPENPPVPPDLTTASAFDPEGDDFGTPQDADDFADLNPTRWIFTNGVEGNKNVVPIPDTEDLNLNRNLDADNDYFEYTIDLSDTTYLDTDVPVSFTNFANDGTPLNPDNGWRRFRIPIDDERRRQFGSPQLQFTQHVRIWIEDVVETDPSPALVADKLGIDPNKKPQEGRPFLLLGGFEIVGSRWFVNTDSTAVSFGPSTTLTLNSVNTLDNADIYVPPFDPGKTRSGSQELSRREQSLAFEFVNLTPGDTLEAYKTFSLDENYDRYGSLNWFTASFEIPGYNAAVDTSVRSFIRFASDEQGRNYYEVNAPLPPSSSRAQIQWQDIALKLTDISNLKLNSDFPETGDILYRRPGKHPGEEYVIRGRPAFTRIRRISFGLMYGGSAGPIFPTGQVWLDELRATDVIKSPGQAQRINLAGRFANLLSYNLAWNGRDADFQSVGETRGSGSRNSNINFTGTFDLHRFFEATGIVMPVSFGYSGNRAEPRFTAGDDVVRTGVAADLSTTQSVGRTISTSYSRSWSDRANPYLRYTVGGITASWSHSDNDGFNPIASQSARSMGAAVNYDISPRRLLALPLPMPAFLQQKGAPAAKPKLYPLPERFYWHYSLGTSRNTSLSREVDSTGVPRLLNDTEGRTAFVDFGADSRPFDLFHHSFSARRNLTLAEPLREQFGFVNLGRVVNWRQNMDARYQVNRFSQWIRPSLSWNSTYTQNNGPELSPDLGIKAISNGQGVQMNWDFPFDRLAARALATPPVRPTPTLNRSFPPGPVGDSLRRVAMDSLRRAQPDTVRRPAGPPIWSTLIGRLGAISTDANYNKSSDYSRVRGAPPFGYLTGLSSDPGLADTTGRVVPQFGNRSTQAEDWRFGARTRVDMGFGASLLTRGSLSNRNSTSNNVSARNDRNDFALEVQYGRVVNLIGLKRFLTNPTLASSYNQSQSIDYSNSRNPTTKSASSAWQPLVKISGDLKNGTRTELKLDRTITKSENLQLGHAVTTTRITNVDFAVNRSYSQGQKVNFLGKETTVRSRVDLGLTASYSRKSSETLEDVLNRQVERNPQKSDNLSTRATGAYGFSNNVTGNLNLGFSQDRNLERGSVTRRVTVELRAQFTF